MNALSLDQLKGDSVQMLTSNLRHITETGALAGEEGNTEGESFENVMLKALDGVNQYQQDSSAKIQQVMVDPESIDPQDVTIAMAEANLSLNIARTVMDRVVRGWKEVINTR